MSLLHNDPEHWRLRAEEARDMAVKMTDLKGKAAMLEIAERYERLAMRAVERLSDTRVYLQKSETRPDDRRKA